MDINQELFLLVVEEMSFTKAANRAYMSQQAVSERIHKLESAYDVKLFVRRPRLQLTEEGEILRRALLRIHNQERDVRLQFEQISKGVVGSINLGLNSSRGSQMIPRIFPEYKKSFPQVSISVYSDDTVTMLDRLRHGDLDIVFGVEAPFDPVFDYIHMTNDDVYFVVSQHLLKETLNPCEAALREWQEKGMPLDAISRFPVAMNTRRSTIASLIGSVMDRNYLRLDIVLRTSNFLAQLELCAAHQLGIFFPTAMLPAMIQHNRTCPDPEGRLWALRIDSGDTVMRLRLDCILLKGDFPPNPDIPSKGESQRPEDALKALPAFKAEFIKMVRRDSLRRREEVNDYLAGQTLSASDRKSL